MAKPYIDPNERPVQGGPIDPRQMGLLSMVLPSPVGDVVGLLSDAAGYAKDPKSLTVGSGLLSLAGLLPLIPGRLSKIKPYDFNGKPLATEVDIIANPTSGDLSRNFGKGTTRWLRSKEGDLYFWPAENAHHEGIAKHLTKMGAEFKPTGDFHFPLPGQSLEPVSGYATFGKGGLLLTDQNNKAFTMKQLLGVPYGD